MGCFVVRAVLCCILICATAYDLSDPTADHTEHAIARDEAGDMAGAVASFRAAAKFAPEDSEHWLNLATALGDESFSARGEATSKTERVRALRRALAIDSQLDEAREQLRELKEREVDSSEAQNSMVVGVDSTATQSSKPAQLEPSSLPSISIDLDSAKRSPPATAFNTQAIQHATQGDLSTAYEHFVAATQIDSYREDVWGNLAQISVDLAQSKYARAGTHSALATALALACDAQAALEISDLLRGKRQRHVEQKLAALFNDLGFDARSSDARKHAKHVDTAAVAAPSYGQSVVACYRSEALRTRRGRQRRAVVLAKRDIIAAAKTACGDVDAVRVTIPDTDRARGRASDLGKTGILSATFMLELLSVMRVCGVAAVRNMYDSAFIEQIEAAHHEEFKQDKAQLKGSFEGTKIASRSDKRYEIKWPLRSPFTDERLVMNPALVSGVKAVLGGDHLELDTFSHVDSLPGAGMQQWHGDVDPIFKRTGSRTSMEEQFSTPTMGLVVIVPVVDVDAHNGPTEFATGSHMNLGIDYWPSAVESEVPPTPHLAIPAKRGDIVLFDLRTYHRGTPNRSNKVRPIIYMSYVHAWFRDEVNFRQRQTRAWDTEFDSVAMRRLFMRVDSARYVQNLERLVQDKLKMDVSELQSALEFRAVKMKI